MSHNVNYVNFKKELAKRCRPDTEKRMVLDGIRIRGRERNRHEGAVGFEPAGTDAVTSPLGCLLVEHIDELEGLDVHNPLSVSLSSGLRQGQKGHGHERVPLAVSG
jgi:hypothetical protein